MENDVGRRKEKINYVGLNRQYNVRFFRLLKLLFLINKMKTKIKSNQIQAESSFKI